MEAHVQPEAVWQAVLGELQLSLPRHVYDHWLAGTTGLAFEDGCLLVGTPSAFAQEWLNARLKGTIQRRLQRICGRSVEPLFVVRPETASTPDIPDAEPPLLNLSAEHDRFDGRWHSTDTGLIPHLTFDSFVVGESNRFAYAASQAVAQDPNRRYNPLFLYGGVGLGKTHLLHAIGNSALRAGYSVRYVTSETFTNDLIEAIRTKTNTAFRRHYREVDVLLIDDIQFLEGKPSTQIEFFHTFNSLYATNKQLVVASDRPPQHFLQFDDRLRSRLEGGLTVELLPPDLELRIAILRAAATRAGVAAPDEALRYIAGRYVQNVRELQGALNRVVAYARHQSRPLTLALVEDVLGEPEGTVDADPQAILEAVATEFRITPAELTGPRRSRRVVRPRQVAMYLLRDLCQLSFPQIGEVLGGRDHTTAMHGYEKIVQEMENDDELRRHLEQVRVRLLRRT